LRGLVEQEEKEQGSKITSDDIKEGFSSGVSHPTLVDNDLSRLATNG
jgi:hypothetical protein